MTERPFDYEVDAMTRWQQFVKWLSGDKTTLGIIILSVVTFLYLGMQMIRFLLH